MPHKGVAAFDTTTGLVDAWNPDVDGGVYGMALSGTTLYVGGDFESVGGQPRDYAAAFDTTTNTLTAWDPDADDYLYSLVASGSVVYVGGDFDTIGGQPRTGIAALDVATGLATAWNPGADGSVENLVVTGGTVYACGSFDVIGGQPRSSLAAIDAATGVVTAWDPAPDFSVDVMLVAGSRLYVGGGFEQIGGASRAGVAAFDLASGLLEPFECHSEGRVFTMAAQAAQLYLGGTFATVGGVIRKSLAAFDAQTGMPTAWSVNADGFVNAIAVRGDTLYVAGNFTEVGGQPRSSLAAIDIPSATLTAWGPGVNGEGIRDMVLTGTTAYISGGFTTVGGVGRNGLAAVDLATGTVTAWAPEPDVGFGPDLTLSADESLVYVCGDFTFVGGAARTGLAAIDAATGLATAWSPSLPTGGITCTDLSRDGETLYVGGFFSTLDGQPRTHLAAFETGSHTLTSFAPSCDAIVYNIHAGADGTSLYANGFFTALGGQPREKVGAVDVETGLATSWAPTARNGSSSRRFIATEGSTVFLGMEMDMGVDRPRRGFVEFRTSDPTSFCDAGDGALASCPCANPGSPDTGCDIRQETGGVRLTIAAQETSPLNRATLLGAGFPTSTAPAAVVIRSSSLDPGSPVVFGDGLRCVGVPLVRLAATAASAGTSLHTFGHGSMAGAGPAYYQLWFRNTPAMFCDPAAAFNLSNGRILTW